MQKVVLITGTSSGIGFASLKKLVSDGHTVYGTVRSKKDFKAITEAGGKPLIMEMTDYGSIEKTVKQIIQNEGKIDVLFNNAGYGLYGTVEDVPLEAAKHQFEVNLFGLAKVTQSVLPHMREAGQGTIINTSSMGGKIYTPMGAWYHATKHALEGWSDSLRLELKQFNIDVVIIEPGGIQTAWSQTAIDNILKYSRSGAYQQFAKNVADKTFEGYNNKTMSPPSVVAEVVAKAVASKGPKTRYPVGKFARRAIFARKFFGDRVFDWLITRSVK